MAVAYVASPVVVQTASHNSSQAITVPASATFALVGFGGYSWVLSGSSCSLGGQSGVNIAEAGGGADEQSGMWRVSGFGTGSQTLAWTLNGTRFDGLQIGIKFFSGVDATTPVRSSGTSLAASISIALSSVAGDMGVLFISDWASAPANSAPGGSGQTEVISSGPYPGGPDNCISASYEASAGTTTTLTGTATGDHSAIGVVLAAAAGGAATSLLPGLARRNLSGLIVR